MPATQTPSITTQLLAVLREAFEGPQQRWTYFVDNRPGTGVFGSIATLTPEQASQPSGPNGSSIAGHLHHLAFSCAASAGWIRGERPSLNWDDSWRVRSVTDAQWTALKDQLRHDYHALIEAVEHHALDSEEALGGAVGTVAHSAYHLAVIRHKAGASR
jgi:hypothetical protein